MKKGFSRFWVAAALAAVVLAGCDNLMKGDITSLDPGTVTDAAGFMTAINSSVIKNITITESFVVTEDVTVDYPKTINVKEGCTVSVPLLTVNAQLILNGKGALAKALKSSGGIMLNTITVKTTEFGIFKVRIGLTVSPEITLELNEGIKLAFDADVKKDDVQIKGVLKVESEESYYKIPAAGGETIEFTLSGSGTIQIGETEAILVVDVTVQVRYEEGSVKVYSHAVSPTQGVIDLSWEAGAASYTVKYSATDDEATALELDAALIDAEKGTVSLPDNTAGPFGGANYYVWVTANTGRTYSGYGAVHFTEHDLANIGRDERLPLTGNYQLSRDLDLSVLEDEYEELTGGWTPIGASESSPFSGQFDGKNHAVRNLALAQYDTQYIGLFGYVLGTEGSHAGIKNFTITLDADYSELDLTLQANQFAGIVSGIAQYTDFENITIQGGGITLDKTGETGNYYFGGITGRGNDVDIKNCDSTMNITAAGPVAAVGGLSGDGSPKITGCAYTGNIVIGDCDRALGVDVGGISGKSTTISGSHVSGTITVGDRNGIVNAGGVVGTGGASKSSFSGIITVENSNSIKAGGIVGDGTAAIAECRTNGSISVKRNKDVNGAVDAGGIAGANSIAGTIKDCYSSMEKIEVEVLGTTTGLHGRAGGIAGSAAGAVSNCYSAVPVITAKAIGNTIVGGITATGPSNATQKNNYVKNVVLLGKFTGIKGASVAVKVNRISTSNLTQTTNYASDAVVLMSETTQLYPEGSQTLDNKLDATTKTAAELRVAEFFLGTGDGQLGWDTNKWVWDSVNSRPKLAWE
jgi:hypothetical protein